MKKYYIKGIPKALARPRFSYGHVYNKQRDELDAFGWALRACGAQLMEDAICMELMFEMPIAKNYPMKKRADLVGKPHAQRPDLDNLIKFVLDASLGILYRDDSIVSAIMACKIYALEPGTTIIIRERRE